jgi:hypothetical protein
MVEALMRHDWYVLGADITSDADTGHPTEQAVPGLGAALPPDVADPAPLAVERGRLGQLDAQWIYLIDAASDTFSVIDSETMFVIARYPFAASTDTPPA